MPSFVIALASLNWRCYWWYNNALETTPYIQFWKYPMCKSNHTNKFSKSGWICRFYMISLLEYTSIRFFQLLIYNSLMKTKLPDVKTIRSEIIFGLDSNNIAFIHQPEWFSRTPRIMPWAGCFNFKRLVNSYRGIFLKMWSCWICFTFWLLYVLIYEVRGHTNITSCLRDKFPLRRCRSVTLQLDPPKH